MRIKTLSLSFTFVLCLIVVLAGCEVIFPPTTYEAAATRITYEISYGYRIRSTGAGSFDITYLCDTPAVLNGTTTYSLLYDADYQIRTMFDNTMIQWNISGINQKDFDVGVTATVEAASYLVADLNGTNSLTIDDITKGYPETINQYTRLQANETVRFIDPLDPEIRSIATMIVQNAQTNNSFELAKSIFAWLKSNLQYQTHPSELGVRPAAVTMQSKQGDCDDLSFLYISLCRASQIPARFVRGYLLTNTNGQITATAHAWVEVFVGGSGSLNGWIPIECACASDSVEINVHQNFGVETAFHLRLFVDDGSNESLATSLTGISYVVHEKNTVVELQSFAEIRNYQVLESKKLIITGKNIRYYD